MEILIALVIFGIALLLVIKASDIFLDSAIWIARTFRIPDLIIGATLVSICTTLPETIVSISSIISGLDGMAFGNALGSINFNAGVILAIVFLCATPRLREKRSLIVNLVTMCGMLLLVFGSVFLVDEVSRICGLLLIICFGFYLFRNVRAARRGAPAAQFEDHGKPKGGLARNLLFLALGAGGTVFGSHLMVENGSLIASYLGVSDMIIGLTMTAVGTSLPELMTGINSIRKNTPDISVGNIIGANLLNMMIVIGLSASINPLNVDPLKAYYHLGAALLVTLMLLILVFIRRKSFKRIDGAALLVFYAAYMALSIMRFS